MIEITNDRSRIDVDRVHAWLTTAYWSVGIPRDVVARAMERSLCFAAFVDSTQAGFARVVTDGTTYAYLCDVIVDEAHRGKGVGKALIAAVMAHPELRDVRRMGLVTHDAQALYQPFGFGALASPGRHMELVRPTVYAEPPHA
jgi:ribosomal protein S18 acetylase RimI-like enzyme